MEHQQLACGLDKMDARASRDRRYLLSVTRERHDE
jgi:hypothetical protein